MFNSFVSLNKINLSQFGFVLAVHCVSKNYLHFECIYKVKFSQSMDKQIHLYDSWMILIFVVFLPNRFRIIIDDTKRETAINIYSETDFNLDSPYSFGDFSVILKSNVRLSFRCSIKIPNSNIYS